MKCSTCNTEMNLVEKYPTYRDDGKEYIREIYTCTKDDVWITVEKPTGSSKNRA